MPDLPSTKSRGATGPNSEALEFGPFRLLRTRRQLFDGTRLVRLSSRALDILIALVERAGEVVGRNELMACVWPNEVVEENTLRVHIAALRKALGDGHREARYINTIPGRGYCFVAPVRRTSGDRQVAASLAPAKGALPLQPGRLIGREQAFETLVRQLRSHRFVSIVGPGGMGKSVLAVSVANAVTGMFRDGVYFVDLSVISPGESGSAVMEAFESSLAVSNLESESGNRLLGHLRGKQVLIVVDNCEHVVDAVAPLIEAVLGYSPELRVLTTSREPINALGEWVHLLPSLEFPQVNGEMSAADALRFAAVELFVERASANDDTFQLNAQNAGAVVAICRQLDGNPLAIELVAGMTRTFGVHGLAVGLDAKLLELKSSRRTVVERHQTLSAMLDWSYQLLSPNEQVVLRRLSVFKASMSLDGAICVASGSHLSAPAAQEAIVGLVSKSWLFPDASIDPIRFQMHGLARTFAGERLRSATESHEVSRRHAEHMRAVVARAKAAWPTAERCDWMELYSRESLDIRAAAAYLMSSPDGLIPAADLIAEAWTLGYLLFEYAEYETLVLRLLGELEPAGTSPIHEMRLHVALMMLTGPQLGGPDTLSRRHMQRAVELAQRHGGPVERLDGLLGTFVGNITGGEQATALQVSESAASLAREIGDPVSILVTDRMRAQAHHFMGNFERGRSLAERVLNHPIRRGALGAASGPLDHRVSMRIIMARTMWLQGFADQAWATCSELLELSERDGPMAVCQGIGLAALPVALWRGDRETARVLTDRLTPEARTQPLYGFWQPWAAAVHELLRPNLSTRQRSDIVSQIPHALLVDHLATFDVGCSSELASARVRSGAVGWNVPEVLRREAESCLRDHGDRVKAEDIARRALSFARAQGSLAWELRCATTLAHVLESGRCDAEGSAVLAAVYGKFTEGFDTSDLRVARATLEARGIVASKVSTTGDGASDVPVDLDAARVESGDRRRRR